MNNLHEPTALMILSAMLLGVSGIPGLFVFSKVAGQRCAAILSLLASFTGGYAIYLEFSGVKAETYQILWTLPFESAFLSLDSLSTLFLIPLFIIAGCAAIYSLAYWPAAERSDASQLSFFMGLFVFSMILVVMARNIVVFLMAWEIMALAAYFLVITDNQNQEVQRVGTVYLLATHTGTAILVLMFSLISNSTGSFEFPAIHSMLSNNPLAPVIIIAALIGFGGKAGIMPLHFWLPGAHANAPSHVSAIMSGLMLKMGIYGILRTLSFFDNLPSWVGWVIFCSGLISAVFGIALAAVQKDLKRMLAFSSIENVGIIFTGIGLALIGMDRNSIFLVVCGFAGSFIHIINHALFKSLLFLGSGVLIHSTGTREIDLMGGMAKKMPFTSALFLTGSIAICGLPPLNGFIGEIFLYIAAITDGIVSPLPIAVLAAPALALVGGIAVITFVKLYGIIFLGTPRSSGAANTHEGHWMMTGSMSVLAICCISGGLMPFVLLKLVTPVLSFYCSLPVVEVMRLTARIPLFQLAMVNLGLFFVIALLMFFYIMRLKRSHVTEKQTWGCGYLVPTSRMQYTGTSFSELTVATFGSVVAPLRNRPEFKMLPFPDSCFSFSYSIMETILEKFLTPLFFLTDFGFSYIRRLQHGQLHIYMLYIFVTLLVLLLWSY